ncbi:Crp/Fnr family transcriptional regulator [Sediminitomix flava]|uniref:CRP-like cAMP-binding protein n=1 Tax=Sediminitomix flava TaxID=379075 RepID=A0A315ZA23_SEDFL|nr:Crp/Fnr family transcriptional regulator [Sediminitomix flava]PWJ41054.1 CRP-like cAMP-binding protein [Sediminitomix flava]
MANSAKLRAFFETDFPLNKEGLEELFTAFQTEIYTKNELILRNGDSERQLRFLNSGNIREYYATTDKETNINFYTSPQFITDFSAFNNNTKTKKYQECLSEVELKILDKEVFLNLLEKYQCGKSFIDLTFQRLLEQKEQHEFDRLTKSADELYQDILKNHPNWLHKIPQYHIASYLGVTPETLSRIRKRIS